MPIELIAEENITLSDEGPGNRERFASIFRQVWADVLPAHKEDILKYWRKFPGPIIDLVEGHRYPGENEEHGCAIKFNARVVDWAPEEQVAALIAHELGHVWAYTTLKSKSSKATMLPANERDKIREDEADEFATKWGYDMAALRAWGQQNIESFREFGCQIPDGFTY